MRATERPLQVRADVRYQNMRLTIIFLFILVLSSAVCADNYNLEKVKMLAEINDCTPLWHNPKVGPVIKFWYSDISTITRRPDEFLFMCQLNSDPRVFRIIISTSSDRMLWKRCPSEIDLGPVVPFPSGLAVRTVEDPDYFRLKLSEWHYDEGTNGPEDTIPTAPIIDTSDKTAGELFYCYDGRWLRLFVD